jgi:hypothetical protein
MGWAERLNPKSNWNLRNAKRIVAKHKKLEEEKISQEALNKIQEMKGVIND